MNSIILLLLCFLASFVGASPMTVSLEPHAPLTPLKRVLVLLDSAELKNESSGFFDGLSAQGYQLKFRKISESASISVKVNGEFGYDNLIVLVRTNVAPNDRTISNILEFVDAGGNLLIGTSGNSKFVRDLAFECGVRVGEFRVMDRFAPSMGETLSLPWPVASERVVGSSPGGDPRIKFVGTTCEPSNEAAAMGAVSVLTGATTSYQKNVGTSGSKLSLVSSVQMRNNARVSIVGSVDMFSDALGSSSVFNERLAKWTFGDASVLVIEAWAHRRFDGMPAERQLKHEPEHNLPRSHFPDPEWGPDAKNYRIKDDVRFSMKLKVRDFDGKWKPYVADDVQVEFVMLDAYERRTFASDKDGNYKAEFKLPDQYGTFKFRVVYNRPGVSSLRLIDVVNVRPFRHDEYERFIFAAYPYYAATGVVMLGFLVFSIAFAYVPKTRLKTA